MPSCHVPAVGWSAPSRNQPPSPPPCSLAPQLQAGFILPCSAKPTSDCVVEANSDWGVHTIEKW